MEFFLQVEGDALKGWDHEVRTEVKWVRRHVHPDEPPSHTSAEPTRRIPASEWKNASWVTAGGKTRRARLAWRPVFLQHELRHAGGELEKVWLVVDWSRAIPNLITTVWLTCTGRRRKLSA